MPVCHWLPHRDTLWGVTRHATHAQNAPRRLLGWLIAALVLILAAAVLTLWQLQDSESALGETPEASPATATVNTSPAATTEPTPEPTPEPSQASFSILAGGDVLPHTPVHNSARNGSGYDFAPLLAGIDTWVQNAGLALCHMEVPLVPDGQQISGYPMFAASPDLAPALFAQGWNGCSTASNHSVDRKFAGVTKTLTVFDEVGLGHVGTARTEEESGQPQVYTITVDGVDTVIAHLSATYGTNGLPIPAEQPWSVQLIDTDKLAEQARTARAAGADLVLVSIHAGNEYQKTPTQQQLDTASALAESGEVDLMIGHHAHVPQPMTKLDGGPHGDGMWVAYGLGNMISNQDTQCCVAETNSGLLLSAGVSHTAGEPAVIDELHWIGITVDRLDGHKLYALADIADNPDGVGKLSATEIEARYERVRKAVGSQIPEQTQPSPEQDLIVTVEPRGTTTED